MKTLLLILACLLGTAGIAHAETNEDRLFKALTSAQAAGEVVQSSLDRTIGQREAYKRELDEAADVSGKKDQTIAQKTAEIEKLKTDADNAKNARVGLISAALGVPGGLFIAAGIAAAVILGLIAVGVKLAGAGMFLVTEGIAVAVHSDKIGLMGLWLMAAAAGVTLLGVALWVAHDVKNHRDAGVENATLIPLAKASGLFSVDQIEWLEKTAYIEGGKLADKMRALAEGVKLKDLVQRVKAALTRGK